MNHAARQVAQFTPSMFDTLLQRWQSLPSHTADASQASTAARMTQASAILKKTLERHLPHLAPDDQALHARLVDAQQPQVWHDHLFDCLDLMARTRGAVVAVLQLRDIYLLLRGTDTAPPVTAMHKPGLAHA